MLSRLNPRRLFTSFRSDVSLVKGSRLSSSLSHENYSNNGGDSNKNNEFKSLKRDGYLWYALAIGAGGLLSGLNTNNKVKALKLKKDDVENNVFTQDEVSKHSSLDKGVWISYKGKVYDITEFIKHHPGGSHTIMMGAGGDVEAFWETYTFHHAAEVQNLLSSFQIGILDPKDVISGRPTDSRPDSPYANDPERSKLLQVLVQEPFNAETPSKLLAESKYTPNDIFFVRNHLPVPEVDVNDYKLTIAVGSDGDPENQKILGEFTLDQLKSEFRAHTIECVIQCSGNRRSDLKRIAEIKGLDWKVGAISNATWTGVRLVDVLDRLGLPAHKRLELEQQYQHVQLEGLDCDMSGQAYGASISSDVAFDPKRDVLLAYEMNGEPLTRDHGFPLRFIAPGITGARNVKWLSKIILSREESNSHWQRNDYKSFSPNVNMFNIDYAKAPSIQEMPVQSAICVPCDGDTIQVQVARPTTTTETSSKSALTVTPTSGATNQQDETNGFEHDCGGGAGASIVATIPVRGYSYSGGGKMIVRVDVSIDNGRTWLTANLDDAPTAVSSDRPAHGGETDGSEDVQVVTGTVLDGRRAGTPDYSHRNNTWSWTRWSANIPITMDTIAHGQLEILCRAFDSAYNSQPERAETVWNVRGVVNNSWHKIKVKLNCVCER